MGVIYLVRHGQARPDAYGPLGSPGAGPLTELGRLQAAETGRALAGRIGFVDTALSGDLLRHRETLSIIMERLGSDTTATHDPAWNEYDLDAILGGGGLASSMSGRELQRLVDTALSGWVGPDGRNPDGTETFADFRRRCALALESARRAAGRGRTVLVVASAGIISQIAAQVWGVSGSDWVRLSRTMVNLSVTKLLVGAEDVSVLSFNEHAHLEAAGRTRLTTFR